MALITVHLGLVSPQGSNDVPFVAAGRAEFIPVTHGKYDGAFRTIETINASIVQGVMKPVELTPGAWTVTVHPTKGYPWPPITFILEEGMPEPVNLVDLAPDIVVKGKEYAKGDRGPAGPGVSGGYPDEDGKLVLTLDNGWITEPIPLPEGPQGPRGEIGPEGLQGPQGIKGDRGEQGVQGPKGDKGDKGDTGTQGPAGPTKLSLLQDIDTTTLTIGDTLTYAGSGQWKSDSTLAKAWSRSTDHSINMVHNGSGIYGSENFTGFNQILDDTPTGASRAWAIDIPGARWTDYQLPIDPNRSYVMECMVRQANIDFPGSDRFYMAIQPIDVDGLIISPQTYTRRVGTQTTLAKPLNPGDTTAEIEEYSDGWGDGAISNGYLAVYDYKSASGIVWGTEYTRNVYRIASVSGTTVTLAAPYNGITPAPGGTPIGMHMTGGAYMYPLVPTDIPYSWTKYVSNTIGGVHKEEGVVSTTQFPKPTASVNLGFLFNYTNQYDSRHRVANVGFYDITDTIKGTQAAYWSGWRNVTSTVYSGNSGTVLLSRRGNEISMRLIDIETEAGGDDRSIVPVPYGFADSVPSSIKSQLGIVTSSDGNTIRSVVTRDNKIIIENIPESTKLTGNITWITEQAIPASLPGSAA